jgi:hypothetical protein
MKNLFGKENMKTREDKRIVKLDFLFFSKLPSWSTHKEKNIYHIHFLVHDHSPWSTFNLHLVGGPKDIVN